MPTRLPTSQPAFTRLDSEGRMILTPPPRRPQDEAREGAAILVGLMLSALSGAFIGAVGALLLASV